MNKYYEVVTKCGHVGRNNYIEIPFAIIAENIHEATRIARYMPRVKHHMKDAITSAREITFEEYQELSEQNRANPYLQCRSIQEQRNFQEIIEPQIIRIESKKEPRDSKRKLAGFRRLKEKEYLDSLLLEIPFLMDGQQLVMA